jgi:hypothetical protein
MWIRELTLEAKFGGPIQKKGRVGRPRQGQGLNPKLWWAQVYLWNRGWGWGGVGPLGGEGGAKSHTIII